MKMQHRNCGGEVSDHPDIPPYESEEHGLVPVYICNKCLEEITGDAQITFVPENEMDKIQLEAFKNP